ncbi:MAG: hypothetical protein OXH92_04265 [Bryobacterales bacterium]|nr:hypothetical protein [Bryobacterales bacterium]
MQDKFDSLDHLYEESLITIERFVRRLAEAVPPPQRVAYQGSFVYRHLEKSIEQAIVQKLVRMVNTLHAAQLLQNHGFVQEQGALQRILDEIQEDISFLAYAVIFDDLTDLHRRYLDAFFEEEFDAADALGSTQKRPMIRRKKIRAYIARKEGSDPSLLVEVSRTLSSIFSGYVHAASPHIMDLFSGNPPRFHMRGMRGTPLHLIHQKDLWNHFYRGTMALVFAAKALGDDVLFTEVLAYSRWFKITSVDESGKAPGSH